MSEDWVADLLADGREYIEKNGWWRGAMEGPNGRQVCAVGSLMGALRLLRCDRNMTDPRVRIAGEALARVLPAPPHPSFKTGMDLVLWWNDHHVKDKQEVLDAFAKAEKIWRNKGVDPDA